MVRRSGAAVSERSHTTVNPELTLLLSVAALLVGGLGLALAGWLALASAQSRRAQQAVIQSLQNDLRVLSSSAVAVGERVGRLDRLVGQLAQQQKELGLRQEQIDRSEPEDRSYAHAIKLAGRGAGIDELMEVCDLTRGEAELVAMMHRLERHGEREA